MSCPSSLLPSSLCCTTQRINHLFTDHKWISGTGQASHILTLSFSSFILIWSIDLGGRCIKVWVQADCCIKVCLQTDCCVIGCVQTNIISNSSITIMKQLTLCTSSCSVGEFCHLDHLSSVYPCIGPHHTDTRSSPPLLGTCSRRWSPRHMLSAAWSKWQSSSESPRIWFLHSSLAGDKETVLVRH